ncbi:MAG: DUF4258 domain-containing protein [Caldilineaceae bacterium]|nr:DUF4258 domain-containing protein [Caldilineaceae bacterium]
MHAQLQTNEGEVMRLTAHAEKRMRQRGLTRQDLGYVLRYGCKQHAAGARIYYLRDKDVARRNCRMGEKLRGTAVVIARDAPVIITVWRNRRGGLRRIKRKPVTDNAVWQVQGRKNKFQKQD